MGLITKVVKVKWVTKTKKHYESLGYKYTKMYDEFEAKVEDLSKGSEIKLKCICDNCKKELNWSYKVYKKCVRQNGETYCKKCAKQLFGGEKMRQTKLKNGKSFEQWCKENDRQDVLDRWDYELNNCNPNEIGYASNGKYWFKCDKHKEHKSELKNISGFTSHKELGAMDCYQCKSIGQFIIDNYNEDFLNSVWSTKNKNSPFNYGKSSSQKVWWRCLEGIHEDYKRNCNSANMYNFRCPNCTKERIESFIEEKTRLYLEELGYTVLCEYDCSIIPINPKTKRSLPFDNEIVLKNGKHLIIEVHGEQHYNTHLYETRFKLNKEMAEDKLHQRKLYDRYKRLIAKINKYEYLEIPYTAFDDKDTYKKIINDLLKCLTNK